MKAPNYQDTPNAIDGRPTKNFFLSVLVKDVLIEDAILDLIDNSVDGARRVSSTKRKYNGRHVLINISKDQFEIVDNCGGISIETAQKYAFRFGRDKDFKALIQGAIGEFGVGMKRALFKMGECIRIESRTKTEHFVVNIDVSKWLKSVNWDFEFEIKETVKNDVDSCGTKITVNKLYPGISEEFSSEVFLNRLILLIEDKQVENIESGLKILVNNKETQATAFTLKSSSKELRPIFIEKRIPAQDSRGRRASISVRIYAGTADSDPDRAGWYVSCNGRTIIAADKSERTGWDVKDTRGRVPAYHNQYSKFRGYVFFESENANVLPWNTTKTGVDTDNHIYRSIKQEMIGCMVSVFGFLKALDNEKETTSKSLTTAYANAPVIKLHQITRKSSSFTWKASRKQEVIERLRWIKYQKREDEVERVMELLEVDSTEEVGSRTFDYYMNLEG